MRAGGPFVGRKREAKWVAQSTPGKSNIEVAGQDGLAVGAPRLASRFSAIEHSKGSYSEALRGRDIRRSRKRTRRRDTGPAAHYHVGSSSPDPAEDLGSAVIGGAPMHAHNRAALQNPEEARQRQNGPSVRSLSEMPGFSPTIRPAREYDRIGHGLLPVYLQLMRAHAARAERTVSITKVFLHAGAGNDRRGGRDDQHQADEMGNVGRSPRRSIALATRRPAR